MGACTWTRHRGQVVPEGDQRQTQSAKTREASLHMPKQAKAACRRRQSNNLTTAQCTLRSMTRLSSSAGVRMLLGR